MTDKYFHEAGHTVVGKIFTETFELKFVTTDKTISQRMDPISSGGVERNYPTVQFR